MSTEEIRWEALGECHDCDDEHRWQSGRCGSFAGGWHMDQPKVQGQLMLVRNFAGRCGSAEAT